jgi:hypothetical protein
LELKQKNTEQKHTTVIDGCASVSSLSDQFTFRPAFDSAAAIAFAFTGVKSSGVT